MSASSSSSENVTVRSEFSVSLGCMIGSSLSMLVVLASGLIDFLVAGSSSSFSSSELSS